MPDLRVRRHEDDPLEHVSVLNPFPVSVEEGKVEVEPTYQSGQLNQGLAAESILITLKQGNAIRVQLRGNASYDGTVDFQARVPGGTWANCLYVNIQTAASAPSAAQLSSISTITQYLIFPGAQEYRIAISTATAGNLDVWWQEVSAPLLGGLGIVPGTAATSLGKAEDAAHASGDVGVLSLAVRQAANGPLSGTDGDYEPLQTDANGHLKTNIIDALPAGTNAIGTLAANSGVDIGDVDVLTINGVAPQFDDTDKLAVSLYGRGTAVGDTAIFTQAPATGVGANIGLTSTNSLEVLAVLMGQSRVDGSNYSPLAIESGINGDGVGVTTSSGNLLKVFSAPQLFNGSTLDRQRGVVRTAYLASAARTGDPAVSDRTNYNFRAIAVMVNVSAIGAPAGSITVKIQVKDETSGNYITIFQAATALATTGQRLYVLGEADFAAKIGAGTSETTEAFSGILAGRTYRVLPDHANETDSITYSVDIIEIP